jgi:hypothetical protein
METRVAESTDWPRLLAFFKLVYRPGHPLHSKEFWDWQYGNVKFGRSFISLNDSGNVTGHVGANFGGGYAWIINVYLNEECRGQGILGRLYSLAREFYPLAATAANEAGLGLYRNMRWYRYHDLIRVVKVNPTLIGKSVDEICSENISKFNFFKSPSGHYFEQPGVEGILLNDGSTLVNQSKVGGLRLVDGHDIALVEQFAWENNYGWIDYITSWNDLKLKDLYSKNWVNDTVSGVPWRLNPIVKNYFCDITYLSENPVDRELIVHRSYSDHGRVGSI